MTCDGTYSYFWGSVLDYFQFLQINTFTPYI